MAIARPGNRRTCGEVLKNWPGEWVDQSDPNAPHEATLLHLVTDKAYHFLGWSPVWAFPAAIERTVGWYRRVLPNSSEAAAALEADLAAYESNAVTSHAAWAR